MEEVLRTKFYQDKTVTLQLEQTSIEQIFSKYTEQKVIVLDYKTNELELLEECFLTEKDQTVYLYKLN